MVSFFSVLIILAINVYIHSRFLGKPYNWVMAFIHCDNLCIFLRLFKLFVSKSVVKMFVKSAILQLSFIPLFLFPSLLLDWQFWWLYFISYCILSPTISLLAIGFLLFTVVLHFIIFILSRSVHLECGVESLVQSWGLWYISPSSQESVWYCLLSDVRKWLFIVPCLVFWLFMV